MKAWNLFETGWVLLLFTGCLSAGQQQPEQAENKEFAPEMVNFVSFRANPVFKGTGTDSWDKQIRERGFILYEDSLYRMWYTGYNGRDSVTKHLGYATSKDGIHWERYPKNPIFTGRWTEDVCVIKNSGKYYMFAEGRNDVAHSLVSDDGISWVDEGDLVMRTKAGEAIPGPYGTPAAWHENGKWYLFYERNDEGIWLARSEDHRTWTNVQDEPVIEKGPGGYDRGAVAANQVVKYKGRYYLYYHASSDPMNAATAWSSNVAMSTDLVHWVKYPRNPIITGNHSSPLTVFDGSYKLYTMHPEVCLYLPGGTGE